MDRGKGGAMSHPLNGGAKLYCEYSEILGVPDNLVRWKMR